SRGKSLRGSGISLISIYSGALGGDIGPGLYVLKLRQHLAGLHVVAFLHVQAGDLAHSVGTHVHVWLGFDLSGGTDYRGKVLARDRTRLYRDGVPLTLRDAKCDQADHDDRDGDNDYDLFHGCFNPELCLADKRQTDWGLG